MTDLSSELRQMNAAICDLKRLTARLKSIVILLVLAVVALALVPRLMSGQERAGSGRAGAIFARSLSIVDDKGIARTLLNEHGLQVNGAWGLPGAYVGVDQHRQPHFSLVFESEGSQSGPRPATTMRVGRLPDGGIGATFKDPQGRDLGWNGQ